MKDSPDIMLDNNSSFLTALEKDDCKEGGEEKRDIRTCELPSTITESASPIAELEILDKPLVLRPETDLQAPVQFSEPVGHVQIRDTKKSLTGVIDTISNDETSSESEDELARQKLCSSYLFFIYFVCNKIFFFKYQISILKIFLVRPLSEESGIEKGWLPEMILTKYVSASRFN